MVIGMVGFRLVTGCGDATTTNDSERPRRTLLARPEWARRNRRHRDTEPASVPGAQNTGGEGGRRNVGLRDTETQRHRERENRYFGVLTSDSLPLGVPSVSALPPIESSFSPPYSTRPLLLFRPLPRSVPRRVPPPPRPVPLDHPPRVQDTQFVPRTPDDLCRQRQPVRRQAGGDDDRGPAEAVEGV